MITTFLFDFAHVILLPKDKSYTGALNDTYKDMQSQGNYTVWNEFILNAELLQYIANNLKPYPSYIFTTGTVHKDKAILPYVKDLFVKMYSVAEIDRQSFSTNKSKKDPASYIYIADDIGKKPEEILFVDDSLSNIEAAKTAGLQTIHFQSNAQFFSELRKLL